MTSINAIRFNEYSGAMICDEQRHWNEDRLKIFAAEKIKIVVPDVIRKKFKISAAYGNTGTSTIGDEIRLNIKRKIYQLYLKMSDHNNQFDKFLSLNDIAKLTFEIILNIKNKHINNELKHLFNITLEDFISNKFDLNSNPLAQDIDKIINPHQFSNNIGPIYGNAGILAGCSLDEGFQIFKYSLRELKWEIVYDDFLSLGSGSDLTNIIYSNFYKFITPGKIANLYEPTDILINALLAVYKASQFNRGVGGYFNIIIFQRKDNKILVQDFNDHRSYFAVEIVKCLDSNLINYKLAKFIIENLFFIGTDFQQLYEHFWSSVDNPHHIHKFLRGYNLLNIST